MLRRNDRVPCCVLQNYENWKTRTENCHIQLTVIARTPKLRTGSQQARVGCRNLGERHAIVYTLLPGRFGASPGLLHAWRERRAPIAAGNSQVRVVVRVIRDCLGPETAKVGAFGLELLPAPF